MYKVVHSLPMFFTESREVSWADIDRYVNEMIVANVDTIYSMAYNSRYMQLSNDELVELHYFVADRIKETDISFIVGHPFLSTRNELDDYFTRLKPISEKISAVSMLYPERYYGNHEIIEDFVNVPSDYGFKTLVHEMKLVSGYNGELMDWPEELLFRILEKSNVVGVKEDSKNDDVTTGLIAHFGSEKNIIVAGHGKRRTLDLASAQANTFSWLNGSSMVKPALGMEFCARLNVDGGDSAYIQTYISQFEVPFFHFVKRYGWHMAHKAMLAQRGYSSCERFPMPSPSIHMDEADVIALEKITSFIDD